DLEDQISCELCSFKLRTPFILPDCVGFQWLSNKTKRHVLPVLSQSTVLRSFQLTCPKCRETVHSKPVQNFAVSGLVRAVAGQAGEASPKKPVRSAAKPWSRFFPQ
ncbi:hypothetical protein DFH06DRAFT_1008309, partial [Mycena polygramma]